MDIKYYENGIKLCEKAGLEYFGVSLDDLREFITLATQVQPKVDSKSPAIYNMVLHYGQPKVDKTPDVEEDDEGLDPAVSCLLL